MTVLLERFVVALERIASALEGTRPTEHTVTVEPVVELDMEAVKAQMAAAIGKPGARDSRTAGQPEATDIRGDEA